MTAQVGAAWVPTLKGGSVCTGSPGRSRRSPLPPVGEAPKRRDPRGSLPPPPVTVTSATVSLSPEPPPAPRSRPSAAEWRRTPLDAGFASRRVTSRSSRKERAPGRGGRDRPPPGTAPAAPCARGRHTKEARGELCEGPSAARSLGSTPEPACHRHAEQCQRDREPAAASRRAGTRRASCWDRPGPAVGTWGSLGERRGGRALQASLRARGRHRHRPQGCKRTWLSRGTGRGAGIPDADPTPFLAETARSRVPWNSGCSSVTERGPRGPASKGWP